MTLIRSNRHGPVTSTLLRSHWTHKAFALAIVRFHESQSACAVVGANWRYWRRNDQNAGKTQFPRRQAHPACLGALGWQKIEVPRPGNPRPGIKAGLLCRYGCIVLFRRWRRHFQGIRAHRRQGRLSRRRGQLQRVSHGRHRPAGCSRNQRCRRKKTQGHHCQSQLHHRHHLDGHLSAAPRIRCGRVFVSSQPAVLRPAAAHRVLAKPSASSWRSSRASP